MYKHNNPVLPQLQLEEVRGSSVLVALHADCFHFAAELGVLVDAQVCGHFAQPRQDSISCDLLQGALPSQGILGVGPV